MSQPLKRRWLTMKGLPRLLYLHHSGWNQREIAANLKISQQAVHAWLKRLGIPANGYGTERSYQRCCESRRIVEAMKRLRSAEQCEWPKEEAVSYADSLAPAYTRGLGIVVGTRRG